MLEPTPESPSALATGDYRQRRIALLTQHGKEDAINAVLGPLLGCRVERIAGFDTDMLGTFTRDVSRAGDQLQAARSKARIGMQLSGLPIGMASEGSFGPDPRMFMLPYNRELLVWIDDELGIEIVATASGSTNFSHSLVESWEQAMTFARNAGFPEHYLVVRPNHQDWPQFRKGIADWENLKGAVQWALEVAENGKAFLETDMRAFANPTRMSVIGKAAKALAERLISRCPRCASPGFSPAEAVTGLICEDCGMPTQEAKADWYACVRCDCRELKPRARACAPAGLCAYCNP